MGCRTIIRGHNDASGNVVPVASAVQHLIDCSIEKHDSTYSQMTLRWLQALIAFVISDLKSQTSVSLISRPCVELKRMTSAMANTPPPPCYIVGDDREVRFALYIPLDHFRWALLHTYLLSPRSFSKARSKKE